MSTDKPRILVVEDDPGIGPQVVSGLLQAGLDATLAADGAEALALFAPQDFDLVVLDLMLPEHDGFELLRAWQDRASVPVIVLTADTGLQSRLRSFSLGAVDWIPKPFFMEELLARVRTRLGLGAPAPPRRELPVGQSLLDLDRRQVLREGQPLPLTQHELNLLAVLVTHPDRTFTRRQLAKRALPADGERADRTVDSHISRLRRKLGADAAGLQTVFGVGYLWSET